MKNTDKNTPIPQSLKTAVIRRFLIRIKLDYKPSIVNKSNYDLTIYGKYRVWFNIHWTKIQRLVFFVNGV